MPPHVQVGGGVAYIVEARKCEMLDQQCGFAGSFEISLAVAGMDFVEKPKVTGDRLGKRTIGCRHKRDPAASEFLLPEKIKNLLPVREMSGIKVNAASKLAFKKSTSPKEPKRQQKQCGGVGLEEDDDALPQQVSPDQSAVKIDAQYRRCFRSGLGSGDRPHGIIVANGRTKEGNKWDT
jgi:hypothetical protein